jgi:hypothetical protein
MADNFGIAIDGDQRVTLRFEQFPDTLHERLLGTLQRLEQRLEQMVLAQEPARTGALRQLTGGRVYEHPDRIAAVVGVRSQSANEAKKAAALEYGSHRSLVVRAHTAKLSHLWARAINPIIVYIPSHSRVSDISPQRFLRGPIDAMRGEAVAELRAAVAEAEAEGA